MKLRLYNTLSREIEEFEPASPPLVRIYTCGMTVYNYTHIGHLRAYSNSDVLCRVLEFLGYDVRQVMNVTDVGHMTSDEDAGEDKLEVGAQREGKSVWEIAAFYERDFFDSINKINIRMPQVVCRATEHIEEQIALIKRLEEKGYTYRTKVGVIFDSSKFPDYAKFARLDLDGQDPGFRVEVDPERRQPWDFALWIYNQPNHIMQWDSPWGRGFPGWHVECSAMSMRYLGETLDIHCGGIDHIRVHHTNEIAQSEAATGKPFSRFWFHSGFLNIDSQKMSKSLDNFYTLRDIGERGFVPLSLRYFYYSSSYRKSLNFTWEALEAAQKALNRLWHHAAELPPPEGDPAPDVVEAFMAEACNDLNMPRAMSVVWDLVRSDRPKHQVARTLYHIDKVMALDLANAATRLSDLERIRGAEPEIEALARELAEKRKVFRDEKKYAESDALRDRILELGFTVEDSAGGFKLRPVK